MNAMRSTYGIHYSSVETVCIRLDQESDCQIEPAFFEHQIDHLTLALILYPAYRDYIPVGRID